MCSMQLTFLKWFTGGGQSSTVTHGKDSTMKRDDNIMLVKHYKRLCTN